MPYQCNDNEPLYVEKLGILKEIIDELDNTCYAIVGDWNANLKDIDNSQFANHMLNFCFENNLKISSCVHLPGNSYTYISERWSTNSWLDHIVTSNDFHSCISKIDILYDISDEDHIPIKMNVHSDCIPNLTTSTNNGSTKVRWNFMTDKDVRKYCTLTDKSLHEIYIPTEAVSCKNVHCSDENHIDAINKLYSDIVNSLIQPGEQIMQNDKKKYSHKPGWAEYVDDLYDTSREIRQMWINAGKPRQGPVHDQHVKCKSRFKYALRFIKNNENMLRKEALAKKLADLNPKAFWSEIKNMNNCKTPLPTSIEGVSGGVQIVEFWRTHFSQLLNCVSNSSVHACEYGCDTPSEELVVSIEEVTHAIEKLDLNKACGSDGICSEHLKYSSNILVPTSYVFH